MQLIPSVSIHPLKSTGATSTFFSDQNFFSSLFKFWYFSIFLISFSRILQSPGIAKSMMTHNFAFLSTKIKSGLFASITLSHWIFISLINLISSSSTTPSEQCSYHFSFLSRLYFSHNFQWIIIIIIIIITIIIIIFIIIIIIIIIIITIKLFHVD